MKKTRDEILVGVVIAVTVILGIVGSLWLARGGLSKGYPLYANFTWGAGLKVGAPVWVSGATVGYVADVQFRTDGTLLTELRIRSSQPIPRGSPATVVPNGLFGDVAIGFTPIVSNGVYKEGDTVVAGKPAPGIAALTSKADSITTSINAITTALNKELIAAGGIKDLRATLAGTNQLIASLNGIAVEQSKQLTATMTSLRRATSAVDSAKIDSTIKNLQATSGNVARLTQSLDSTARAIGGIVAKIDNGTGTAGKLINDPGVYNDVRKIMADLDSVVVDVKKNPKRYVPKVSVF
jgi:phospholipid/cholesterol/gamma-HCH transport system substrate-binding protein